MACQECLTCSLSLHLVPIPNPLSRWWPPGMPLEKSWPTPSSGSLASSPSPFSMGAPPSMLWEKPQLCWAPTPAETLRHPESPSLCLLQLQPSHQSHWHTTVCIGMFLYKYMHSRLGQINYFTKLIEQKVKQNEKKNRGTKKKKT